MVLPFLRSFAVWRLYCGIFILLVLSLRITSAQSNPAAPLTTRPAEPQVTISKPSGEGLSAGQQLSTQLSSVQGTSSAPTSSTAGAVNGDYILKSGDSIDMVIYREPDLSIRSKIGNDGFVQLPLLGEVNVAGLSVRSATALIRQKYNADYLVEPQIYLNVSSYNTRKFTIIGQVGRPGTYEFSGSESLGLLEAIGMSGGFTRIADRGHVVVKRREGKEVRTIKVNAKKLTDASVDRFEIQPGDVINVAESWY